VEKHAFMNKSGGSLWFDAQFAPDFVSPYSHVGSPLSAERPSLGCSLPGLARFAWAPAPRDRHSWAETAKPWRSLTPHLSLQPVVKRVYGQSAFGALSGDP